MIKHCRDNRLHDRHLRQSRVEKFYGMSLQGLGKSILKFRRCLMLKQTLLIPRLVVVCGLFLLTACRGNSDSLQVKLLVGSALGDFCHQAAKNFNATQPQLDNGKAFQVRCEAKGSGDVVTKLVSLATQAQEWDIAG